jgi:hypothetical protein
MYPDGWRSLTAEESASWETQVGRRALIDNKYIVDVTQTEMLVHPLAFYDDGMLLMRLRDPGWLDQDLSLYFVFDGNEFRRLAPERSRAAFQALGERLALTEGNVVAYLEFFCFFLRAQGHDTPFYIVPERERDRFLPPAAWDTPTVGQGSGSLTELFRPAVYVGTSLDGLYRCSALVWFEDTLSLADFEIDRSGNVWMARDERLLAELPWQIDARLQ